MSGLFDDSTGARAIISGSFWGIGRAIAIHMAEIGMRVVISPQKTDACEAVTAEITAANGDDRTLTRSPGSAIFLSSQAGLFETGQTIVVDGGITILRIENP